MAVKIRMKLMGRKHRQFFRICALDTRKPRDGRVLEELGTYDPHVPLTDARVLLNRERVNYWLSVGAQPSHKVGIMIKKYGLNGSHLAEQESAREKLALPKVAPPMPEAVVIPPKEEAVAEPVAAAAEAGDGEGAAEADAS